MFENAKPPEDIFAGTETGTTPPPPPTDVASVPASAQTMPETESSPRRGFPWKPIAIVIGAIVVIGGAAGISYALLASRAPAAPVEPTTAATTTPTTTNPAATTKTPTPVPSTTVAPTPVPEPVMTSPDTDKDGLTDREETSLGTDPRKPDTDADGLFDKEEASTYKTDPLNPDTDGDTYLDGAEVKGGYNPSGPGKLFSVPGA